MNLRSIAGWVVLTSVLGVASDIDAQAPRGGRPRDEAAPQQIDLATARKIVAAAEAAALKASARVGIAVVDGNGDLVYSERLDGASSRGVLSAEGKARAALLFGVPTKQVRDAANAGQSLPIRVNVVNNGAETLTINQGGLPILRDGKVIGAVGVGGAESADDERFAQAGIDAAFGATAAGSK